MVNILGLRQCFGHAWTLFILLDRYIYRVWSVSRVIHNFSPQERGLKHKYITMTLELFGFPIK